MDKTQRNPIQAMPPAAKKIFTYLYPCDTQDLDCMRQYFSKSLLCTNSSHDDGSPIQEDRLAAYIPRINMTILTNGTVVTFYGSQITRFREDRSSYNLVITIKYDSINIKSETANYVINQQERESLVVTDSFNLTYSGELSGTVIQGGWTYISFVEVNTDVLTDSSIEVGSSISNSSNEVISQTYEELEADLPTAMMELLFTIAPYSFYVYFQKYICDYAYEYTGAETQRWTSYYFPSSPGQK
ncbi:uncharacterized protein LOC114359354 [Ostrinia furnacalis]|uniref:uncharacterized protein LOC114359354 n=1 Tax=Ostrinia furnacalis TaxID=93504 RepID=UPI001040B5E8|nr:uncharacterized protein LOC114359354 [Ostrinia furnacalis]